MAAQGFILRLAPEYTIGRRFQMAMLSFAPREPDILGDEARLPTLHDYLHAVNSAANHVMERLRLSKARQNCNGGKLQLGRLGSVDCCLYPGTPKLYTAGSSDKNLLKKTLNADTWICAALRYADKVLSQARPLGGSVNDLPWLAKASVFSSYRGPGGGAGETGGKKSGIRYPVDTLGSILLGGAAAFLGSYKLGDTQAEFYLLPEAPSNAYRSLLDALSGGGPQQSSRGNLAGAAVWLVNQAPVSLEAAVSVMLAAKLQDVAEASSESGVVNALGEAKLYLVRSSGRRVRSSGRRPMVAEGIPLSTAHRDVMPNAVKSLLSLAATAAKAPREVKNDAMAAVAGCINGAFLDAANPCTSTGLYNCLRDLDSLAKSPRILRSHRDLAGKARKAAESVHYDLLKALEGC